MLRAHDDISPSFLIFQVGLTLEQIEWKLRRGSFSRTVNRKEYFGNLDNGTSQATKIAWNKLERNQLASREWEKLEQP